MCRSSASAASAASVIVSALVSHLLLCCPSASLATFCRRWGCAPRCVSVLHSLCCHLHHWFSACAAAPALCCILLDCNRCASRDPMRHRGVPSHYVESVGALRPASLGCSAEPGVCFPLPGSCSRRWSLASISSSSAASSRHARVWEQPPPVHDARLRLGQLAPSAAADIHCRASMFQLGMQ
jgi:hypothetical protein